MHEQAQPATRAVPVWDLATRVFHWALVVLVAVNLIVGGEDAGLSFQQHVVFGYLIAALVVFRLVWGFVGSRHSRFSDFVTGRAAALDHARRLLRGDPPHAVGHTALGGWMIVALLVMLAAVTLTGLFGAGRRTAGPLADWVGPTLSGGLGEVHGGLSNLLIALIAGHVAGVAVDWLFSPANPVRAMITGLKPLPLAEAAREPPLAPAWRAAIVALCVVLATAWSFARTDLDALAKPRPGAVERERR